MSDAIEQLKADYAANLEEVAALGPLTSVPDLVSHLQHTLWPFVGELVKNLDEIEGVQEGMYEDSDDILQPETAGFFMALVLGARELCDELEKRAAGDAKLLAGVKRIRIIAQKCQEVLEDITIEVDDDEEGDDDADAEPADAKKAGTP